MSDENDDDRRLYECTRKYDIIVKQFDELIRMVDATTKQSSPKCRKSCGPNSAAAAHAAANESNNEQLVQTLTRFLQELRSNPAEPSSSHDGD